MRVSAYGRGVYMRVYTFILKYLLSEARSWEELSIVVIESERRNNTRYQFFVIPKRDQRA